MRKSKLHLLTMLLVVTFATSTFAPADKVAAADIETNFQVWFSTSSGSRLLEAYSLYIKQSLAPLGIDVKIVAKPWGQFLGDLYHYTTGHPFDFAQVRFGGGGPTPEFGWQYRSELTSFGQNFYQLNDPDWQAWQAVDAGITTAEVDALIDSVDYELDFTVRKAQTDAFAELFMNDLIYDIPMVSRNSRVAVWKGFEPYDVDEGFYGSQALGARWVSNEAIRAGVSNTSTWRTYTSEPPKISFDPMFGSDSATTQLTSIMSLTSLNYDADFGAHPGIAYNFGIKDSVAVDWDNNASTPAEVSEKGRLVFMYRDDAYWSPYTDMAGVDHPAHAVDAYDMMFTYQILKLAEYGIPALDDYINGLENFAGLWDFNVTTTSHADDTLNLWIEPGTATPDDYIVYGGYNPPMPTHILNKTLTYDTGSGFISGNIWELAAQGIIPQDTLEWKHWAGTLNANDYSGVSLVGPYDVREVVKNDFRHYVARNDFFFPNEWDSERYYAANPSGFAALEAEFGVSFATFGPTFYSSAPDAFYWAFDDVGGQEKPTEIATNHFFYSIIEDINAISLAFESGATDLFLSTALGAETVEQHENDPTKQVFAADPDRGAELLVFNLLHPDLKKINVRRAIAHALDKEQLLAIHDGFGVIQNSPVWHSQDPRYYTDFGLDYNYATARNLMRSEGYVASETNVDVVKPPEPPVTSVFNTLTDQAGVLTEVTDTEIAGGNKILSNVTDVLGSEWLFFFSGLAMLSITVIKKSKK